MGLHDHILKFKRKYNMRISFGDGGHGLDQQMFFYLKTMWVPEEKREQYIGTKFMEGLCKEADREKEIIGLNPDPTIESNPPLSKAQLIDWYKGFGFVDNPDKEKFPKVDLIRMPKESR